MWLIIVAIIISIVVIAAHTSNKQKENKESNASYEKKLVSLGFRVSRTYAVDDKAIFVDDVSKRWSFQKNQYDTPKMFSYSDLLDFELFEDNQSVIKGTLGKAIVGGVLLGAVGAIAGSASERRVTQYCNEVRLKITVNDLQTPVINVSLASGRMDKNGVVYALAKSHATQLIGILTYIHSNATVSAK